MSYSPRHLAAPKWKRRASATAASVALASVTLMPGVAEAQQGPFGLPQPAVGSSADITSFVDNARAQLDQATRDTAWNVRNALRQQADVLGNIDPALPGQAKAQIDQTVETLFPGLIAERTPSPAPAPAPSPAPAPAPQPAPAPAFDRGACPPEARACVDLAGQRSWLQNNGQVEYGPVKVSTGMPGQETPRGVHYVNRKVRDEVSYEFNLAPMPFATYFTNNGIAFHEGDPYEMSNGCVHLYHNDAEYYFDNLQIGDEVYVY